MRLHGRSGARCTPCMSYNIGVRLTLHSALTLRRCVHHRVILCQGDSLPHAKEELCVRLSVGSTGTEKYREKIDDAFWSEQVKKKDGTFIWADDMQASDH